MRILIADNQPKVRRALRVLLEQVDQVEVVGEAGNIEGLLEQMETAAPRLVLLGGNLPGLETVDLLPALRQANPAVRVIVLSTQPEIGPTTLAAGADAFLSKTEPPERLLEAIREIKGEKR